MPVEEPEIQQTDTTTQETSETPASTTPSIEEIQQAAAEERRLLMQALREQQTTISSLEAQRLRREQEESAKAEEIDDTPEFLAPQMKAFEKMLDKKLAAVTAPLNEEFQISRRDRELNNVRANLASHAELGPIYAQVKDRVDAVLPSMPNFNEGTVKAVIWSIYGQASATGTLQKAADVSVSKTSNGSPKVTVAATVTNKVEKAPALSITEAERAIARRRGMSDAMWCAYRDSDGSIADFERIEKEFAKK